MKKKVLLILIILVTAIYGCEKYKIEKPIEPVPPPTPFVPDESWIGEGPFFVKTENNNILFLFCNDYVDPAATGSPFFEFSIGNAPMTRVAQIPLPGHANWGSGSIAVSLIIPEDAIICVSFGVGTAYADVRSSRFNYNGVIRFSLITITPQ